MSVRRIPSLKDESRDLQKQIGCMNGIFQIFDRHHFLSGRRSSSGHRHKRLLLQGVQQQQQQDNEQVIAAKEALREKPRTSTESSRESYSSSTTCSTSTFSSMDYNRATQLEPRLLRQTCLPETNVRKEQQQPAPCNNAKSLDLPDQVIHGLSVKFREANEKKGGRVLKHIDSPRPSLQQIDSEKPKTRGYGGTVIRNSREERLVLPRYSYDGRSESRGGRHKEHPRLSLDSKTSSMKHSALESRANFLIIRDRNLAEHEGFGGQVTPVNHETGGSHSRSSSLVAKLMGLDAFPEAATYEDSMETPSSRQYCDTSSVRKPRFPIEPAPWRQKDCGQGSPRMASQNRIVPSDTYTPRVSLSVYGEIEKRITELEFKKSGKDLRALKQILEAMEKTRERLENGRGESAASRQDENSDILTGKDGNSRRRLPTNQRQSGTSPVAITKPAKVADKITKCPRNSSAEMPKLQRLHTREPRYNREASASVHGQKVNERSPRNRLNDSCRNLPSPGKKASWRPSEMERISARPLHGAVENCTTSPRLQQNLHRSSRPTTPTSDKRDANKFRGKKIMEKGSQNRKTNVKARRDMEASDDQFSEISGDTRCSSYQGDTASVISESNNSLVSVNETEIIQRKNYTSRTTKTSMPAALESIATTVDQPSPISVLDDAFYCEDSPSPVKKTWTAFQDAEWHLEEDTKHLTECPRSDYVLDQKLERMKHRIHELSMLCNEHDDGPLMNHNDIHDPDHRYINKVLSTSGLLKDVWGFFIFAAGGHVSSYHLINPDMFHVIEQTEDLHGKKIQRKIIFDMVDEILIRKINSGRYAYALGKKGMSPQALLNELYSEMDRSLLISNYNLDDGEDEITKILRADMKYQSEDWDDYKGEEPALVLDIERLIFKDMINDVIIGEAMEGQDRSKRHRRQLLRT